MRIWPSVRHVTVFPTFVERYFLSNVLKKYQITLKLVQTCLNCQTSVHKSPNSNNNVITSQSGKSMEKNIEKITKSVAFMSIQFDIYI